MTPKDYNLLLQCIGWNSRTWAVPIRKILNETAVLKRNNLHVLELGAGRVSTLGALFFRNTNQVKISYFDESTRSLVAGRVALLSEKNNSTYVKELVQASMLDLHGVYDVIIMKSVLGGVFRNSQSKQNVDGFLKEIAAKHLSDNGVLITIDNGLPFYARLIDRFGARNEHWRYFLPKDFSGSVMQSSFGLFGAFSFKTRLGHFGGLLENLTHLVDTYLFKVFDKSPTVIASVYVKNPTISEPDQTK